MKRDSRVLGRLIKSIKNILFTLTRFERNTTDSHQKAKSEEKRLWSEEKKVSNNIMTSPLIERILLVSTRSFIFTLKLYLSCMESDYEMEEAKRKENIKNAKNNKKKRSE